MKQALIKDVMLFAIGSVLGLAVFGTAAVVALHDIALVYLFASAIVGIVALVVPACLIYGHLHPETIPQHSDPAKHRESIIEGNQFTNEGTSGIIPLFDGIGTSTLGTFRKSE
jgi:hypothetical protein